MPVRWYGWVLVTLVMALPCGAFAGPLDDAKTAFDRGDYATATPIWREFAEKGDARAENALGVVYAMGKGIPAANCAEAAKWFRKAADQGFVLAEVNLGRTYAQCGPAPDFPRDYPAAAEWYRKAAETGSVDAIRLLAGLYWVGQGVPKDDAEAAKWYRQAAEKGDVQSQIRLGDIYSSGIQVPRDYAEAMSWYRKAAAAGSATAEGLIAAMYAAGHGVPKDETEAISWMRKSAEHGNWLAQSYMALVSERNGDHVGAYEWLTVAASGSGGGYRNSLLKQRATIAARMTPDQIQKAEDLAREWSANHPPEHK